MNPYNEVPILVERDHPVRSHIINEYIDERFPHPQLMPGDPVAAPACAVPVQLREGTVRHVNILEGARHQGHRQAAGKARAQIRDRLTQLAPIFLKNKLHAGRRLLDARRRHRAAAVAPGLLRHRPVEERRAAAEVRRAHLLAPAYIEALTPSEKVMRKVSCPTQVTLEPPAARPAVDAPYLIRALHDWCTDNGFTPYVAVFVDASVQVPVEYVKNNEIVLNVGFEATSGLKLGNEFIEFKGPFRRRGARDRRAGRPRGGDLCARERPGAWPSPCPGESGAGDAPMAATGRPKTPAPACNLSCAWPPGLSASPAARPDATRQPPASAARRSSASN